MSRPVGWELDGTLTRSCADVRSVALDSSLLIFLSLLPFRIFGCGPALSPVSAYLTGGWVRGYRRLVGLEAGGGGGSLLLVPVSLYLAEGLLCASTAVS